jgi:ureidoglycolate lyase
MVVIGNSAIDFVVVQYANGVGIEDCQEAELRHEDGSLLIEIPKTTTENASSKL